MYVLFTKFKIKVKVRHDIDLVNQNQVTDAEHQRILQRLVVTFGDGQNHAVFAGSCVELRRTNQVSDIFQNRKIHVFQIKIIQTLSGHLGIKMTHSACVELD